ncbi:adenosine 5'-monophosphoramidase HINT3 [Drosophila biarmipes]|uniref:adenosine 5'-monophosphoramidase HINT3 n=1 Tax=Drosophila biarmipes TaxID=125945 RepID=UPI0007E7CE5D|nr:adenosine 5'-monophosphoramidase HINT3 [Drosophila biarmipes]XP_016962848.1 adenosine 5'-monophosphoramidase HINT3 [Drosophila biarmipes]
MAEDNCIFCKISGGQEPTTVLELETDEFVIFKDIKPASQHHYLAVTKRHYTSLKDLDKTHDALVARMESGLKEFLAGKGISVQDALLGFHLPPFITVKHLHMHAIAPRSEMGFLSRLIFRPSVWFKTAEDARVYLSQVESSQ